MVVCNVDIPRPPALPSFLHKNAPGSVRSKRSCTSQGFRLMENQDDAGSVYSVYKQKIDAMFESDTSVVNENSVQAKIEKMFTDVAIDNGIPINEIGCHVFSVDYLGSVPLHNKVTSLSGLQSPLRELYFAYKRNTKQKKALTGRLEISAIGLKVQYQGEKGDLEQLNSFPTIAVWSAVKFVLHDDTKISYAFLPLITDPDNLDKQSLFRALDSNEKKYITSSSHSPLFAVVMRKIGGQKQLECHGFVCQTSEDAIVIAATLYKSLMAHMKSKDKKPKNKNGVSCMSISSSAFNESSSNAVPVRPPRKKRSTASSVASERENVDIHDTQPLLQSQYRLPKKSSKASRAPKAPTPKIDLDAILPYDDPSSKNTKNKHCSKDSKSNNAGDKWNTYLSAQQNPLASEMQEILRTGSTRRSLRRRNDEGILNKGAIDYSGDILTKVTIPRSGSFLNAGGLTRYKSKMSRSNGQAAGGSPLGFHELFNEFRLQEGLHSVDQILGVIIDPEGMSFNDLKPIYKEFLLKLALTLTKDELYQRSKAIMRRQRKRLHQKYPNLRPKKKHSIVSHKLKGLKRFFRKKFKPKLERKLTKTESSRVVEVLAPKIEEKLPESTISTSSYDTRQFRPKSSPKISRKQSYRKKQNGRERASTSEESDFFSLRKSKSKQSGSNQNKNSSSGYVSCSECSYDSDTCTCVSADKCYCSLGTKQVPKEIDKTRKSTLSSCKQSCQTNEKCYCTLQNPPETESLSWCGCDTDSCTDSNKCYCQKGKQASAINQIAQRRFATSDETPSEHRKLCKMKSNTRSTRSLEYMHNPSERYYEKRRYKTGGNVVNEVSRPKRNSALDSLALDYEMFTVTNKDIQNVQERGVYSRALSESARQTGSQPTSMRAFNSYRTKSGGNRLKSTSVSAGACTEALSVKKSAEIAALFADIKLSQTTDITHIIPHDFDLHSLISNKPKHIKYVPAKSYSRMEKSYTKCERKADRKTSTASISNRMVQNALYAVRNVTGNSMYSARNGLYTIQSQSDESRRSSFNDNVGKDNRNSFNVGSDFPQQNNKSLSCNLENSLGYLP